MGGWNALIRGSTPTLWLRYDEATGAVADSSGNGFDLTAPGAFVRQQPAYVNATRYGVGTGGDYATRADSPALRLIGTDFTIGFWVNCAGNANGRTFLYKDGQWSVGTNGAGKVSFDFPNVAFISGSTPTALRADNWDFVTVTRVGTTYTVYINGVLEVQTTTATAQVASASGVSIGSNGAGDQTDEMFILPAAWSDAEVAAAFALGVPPEWNDVHVDGDRGFQTIRFANLYQRAAEERQQSGAFPEFAYGDSIQNHARILTLQVVGVSFEWVETIPTPGDPYDPLVFYPASLVLWTIRNAHPLANTASLTDAFLGGNGWTINGPREHDDAAATTYTDGSAFANGHKSRNRQTGRTYTRTAGAWVDSGYVRPDVLTRYSTVDASETALGFFRRGDYIFRAVTYNELRDVYNALVDYLASGDVTYNVLTDSREGSGTGSTWAAAKAAAEASFAASASSFFPADGATSWSSGSYNAGTGGYAAQIVAKRVTVRATWKPAAGKNATTQFWAAAEKLFPFDTFDANGTGLTDGTWAHVTDVATTGDYATHTYGSLAVPNWCADPTAAGSTSSGFFLQAGAGGFKGLAIVRNQVPGGFEFTSDT